MFGYGGIHNCRHIDSVPVIYSTSCSEETTVIAKVLSVALILFIGVIPVRQEVLPNIYRRGIFKGINLKHENINNYRR